MTGQAYPQTLADLIAFDAGPSEPRGALERSRSSSSPRRRTAVTPTCAALRQATTPPVQAAIDQLMAAERPRRDHRPDERSGVADERRPRTRATSTATSSTSWARRRRLRCRATPTSRCPPATIAGTADRDHLHRRPLGRTGAARPRLRLRAGDAGSCPAAVHPDDRRRAVPRRPKPAGSAAGAAAAGDPGSARSRRALPVEAYRGDNEARPFGRASCCWPPAWLGCRKVEASGNRTRGRFRTPRDVTR